MDQTSNIIGNIRCCGDTNVCICVCVHRAELASAVGLKGCIKGFQFQKKDFNLLEEPGTIGISSGCPEESFVSGISFIDKRSVAIHFTVLNVFVLIQMSRKAVFNGNGYLGSTAKILPFTNFEGGLNFRTLQPSGLLFYHNEGVSHL